MTTIVHLLPHFENDGNGIVNIVVDLACAQSDAGHTVSCIGSGGGAYCDLLHAHGVKTLVLPGCNWVVNLKLLYSMLKAIRPNIVHAHTTPTAILGRLLRTRLGFHFITSVHNSGQLRNVFLGFGDKVICVSDSIAAEMRRLGFAPSKIKVVRNGPLGSPRRLLASPALQPDQISHPAIVTVGSLHRYKGAQDVISAFSIARKIIPNLSLYILGEGPMKPELEKQAAGLEGHPDIHIEGFVADPRSYYSEADIFVFPSHREAFGLALAEAREAGCAIIGTNVGGIPETLENGRAGVLVPPRSPKDIARTVIELLANPAQLASLKKSAETNTQWLSVDRMSQETLTIYRETLASVAA